MYIYIGRNMGMHHINNTLRVGMLQMHSSSQHVFINTNLHFYIL